MEFKEINSNIYNEFALTHQYANFLNSKLAFDLKEESGSIVKYYAIYDNNQIIAASGIILLRTMKNYYFAYAQRGYLIDFNDYELLKYFTNNLVKELKKQKVIYLKLDPYVPYQERDINGDIVENGFNNQNMIDNLTKLGYQHQGFNIGYDESRQCRWMSVLNLKDKDEDAVFKSFDSKTRRNINNTIKTNVKIRYLKYEDLHIIKEIVDSTSERQHFSEVPLSFYQNEYKGYKDNAAAYYAYIDTEEYLNNINSDIAKQTQIKNNAEEVLKDNPTSIKSNKRLKEANQILTSLQQRKNEANQLIEECGKEVPLAAALFIYYGKEVIYLTGGSYDKYKKLKGPFALQWHLIKKAVNEGYDYYNFYGISGKFKEDEEGYGVFNFKRGFRADIIELLGDFIYPVSPLKYNILKTIKK